MIKENMKNSQTILHELQEFLKTEIKSLNIDNDYQKEKLNKLDYLSTNIEYIQNRQNQLLDNNIRVLDIQEKERQRIARDLHDSSLQNLTHLIHSLELTNKYIDTDIIQARLELATISKNIKEIIEDIRDTIFDLRPMTFDDLGLRDSIERLVEKLNSITNIEISLSISDITCKLPLILMTALRIIQEATTNAVKHSHGKNINISIKENLFNIIILIEDDGEGFNYKNVNNNLGNHYGLRIMEERVKLLNGNLTINSDQSGTKILVEIPNA